MSGWYVFLGRSGGVDCVLDSEAYMNLRAHYRDDDGTPACGKGLVGGFRRWVIAQDVGRIPLCETCKDALMGRASPRVER